MLRFLKSNPMAVIFILFMAYQSMTNGQYNDPMSWIMHKVIILPAILIGLSFHEFAHAFAADRLGDNTPKSQGRVTINPAAHIDPFGLLALFFIGFGWGKPVQVNPWNFKHMRRDGLIVDLAGVTMNLVLAIAFAGILGLLVTVQHDFMLGTSLGKIIVQMLDAIIYINIILMIFNLLPIPPLDGFGILTEVFNLRQKDWYYQVYNNGFMILLLLMIFNVTDKILGTAVYFVYSIVLNLFGLI